MDYHIHKKLRINASEDRISKLPDELIHGILLFLDARSAVKTCILSKRWKLIWTTLPFLSFDERIGKRNFVKFLDHVLDGRNHTSGILQLKLQFRNKGVRSDWLDEYHSDWLDEYVKYAIEHNVQDLHVEDFDWGAPILESKSLKILNLAMTGHRWDFCSIDDWYLPALTSLHLKVTSYDRTLPESSFIFMPALTSLCLEGFVLPHSLSLPGLTKLHLKCGELPDKTEWDLPALISLVLDEVEIGITNITEFLSALVSLQDLKLLCCFQGIHNLLICSPQLLNMELRTTNSENDTQIPSIMIFAPKLLNVTTGGIFSITCCNSKLENVHVKFQGCFKDKIIIPWGMLKQYYCQLMFMFRGLDSARILTLDSDTIEALSAIVDLLQCLSSPFHNLKYVKLPQGYKESNICGTVKNYLLGGSSGATIVTTLPQNDVIPKIAPVDPLTSNGAQNKPEVEEVVTNLDSSVGYNGDEPSSDPSGLGRANEVCLASHQRRKNKRNFSPVLVI